MLTWLDSFFAAGMIKLILFYQKTLSPDHGWFKFKFPVGYCRFTPSCSSYSIEVYKKYGFFIGSLKTIWRLLRCNPFNSGGHDPA